MPQGPIGTHNKQAWKFAWPRNEPGEPPPGVDPRKGQIAVNRNYVDAAVALFGGGGAPPTPPLEGGIGITVDRAAVPGVINLDPAQPAPGEIGGMNEAPSDGTPYARQDAGWVPASAAVGLDAGIGLTLDTTTTPNPTINLDPATAVELGGVTVPARSITQGLALDAAGDLTAPLAANDLAGSIVEPPTDGLAYARKYDAAAVPPAWVWEPTAAAGLQITSVIPDKVIIGEPAPFLVNAYGSEFTNSCVLYFDGVAMPTTFVSATHLTTEVDPSEAPGTARIETVTVEDPAVPEIGAGAAAFEFMVATTQVDYGTGLTLDTAPTPPIVHLQPATDAVIGGLKEPPQTPPDAKDYVRRFNPALPEGWEWAEAKDAKPAGEIVEHIGVVYVPPDRGLSLGTDGSLSLMPASEQEIGGIREPTFGQATWVRHGEGRWVPAPLPTQIAGDDPDEIGVVYVPHDRGLTVNEEGALALMPASEDVIGGLREVPSHPVDSKWVRKYAEWVPAEATTPAGNTVDEIGVVWVPARSAINGLHLGGQGDLQAPLANHEHAGSIVEPPDEGKKYARERDPTTHINQWVEIAVAGHTEPEAGLVWVPARSAINGLALGEQGDLQAPRATHEDAGTIVEPPEEDKQYARFRDPVTHINQWVEVEATGMEEPPQEPVTIWGRSSSGARGWVPIPEQVLDSMEEPPAEPVAIWGRSSAGARGWLAIDQTGVQVAGDSADQLGVVYVPDKRGLQIGPDGALAARIATDVDHGVILDAPNDLQDPTKTYARKFGQWVESEAAKMATHTDLGVVRVTGRSDRQGLVLDDNGFVSAPLATWEHAGSIVEPPNDGKTYARKVENGDPAWVESTGAALTPVGRSPENGLDSGYDQTLNSEVIFVPLATDTLAGSIVEPPPDGQQYVRVNDPMAGRRWALMTAQGVFVGDAPPPNPTHGMQWWSSLTGKMLLFYQDVDSGQWVETAPGAGGGVEEAPIDGTPYVRQDAGWQPTTALSGATPGDVKSGFQAADHAGWILLDGRAITTLTATQQTEAIALGFATNLPNGDGCSLRMEASPLGGVGGSATITRDNLPSLSHSHGTQQKDDVGPVNFQNFNAREEGQGWYAFWDGPFRNQGPTAGYSEKYLVRNTDPGGTNTDYWVKAVVVNFFVFLGA